MATAYHQSPSHLLKIEDDYHAWCVDEAVMLLGRWTENQLEIAAADKKKPAARQAARTAKLEFILNYEVRKEAAQKSKDNPNVKVAPPRGQFKDPASMLR